ncbi:non-ribosomal peptide synthetase, partial [Paenibacillus tyrfis]|uniref:non-ribosomal peptide synthetase n=1 Tax=Paenibacillus tyrfis TaxID=1501230 RepID=UPI002490C720
KPDRHLLLIDMHHIISDGVSMGILTKEFIRLYEGDQLPPLRIQYKDYAAWQQGEVHSRRLRKQEAYWLETFRGEIPVLDLPTDYKRPSIQSFKGNTLEFVLDKQMSEGLRQFAAQTGSTLFMVLLAAYTTLLSRYSGQEDIIVGTPIAGRPHADLEPILGMFVNTLAIRNVPAGEKTFHDYVQEVKESALRAYENQDYPFEELVDKLDVARDLSRSALFDTMFVLQNTEQEELDIEGLKFSPYPNKHNVSKFDLTFTAIEDKEEIACSLEYAASLFKPETAERMAGHFIRLVEAILHDPQTPLAFLEIMTSEEKEQILTRSNSTAADYPREQTIHQLFEEQAERTPEQVAVICGQTSMTYRELNAKSNQLARVLRTKGVQPDRLVGLMAGHSAETLIAMLGILKAGGAYLPIDPSYPEERIAFLLEDSGTHLLLTDQGLTEGISFIGETLDLKDPTLYDAEAENVEEACSSDDLAYVIYTSGSTGKPKGVMVTHKGAVNYLWWAKQAYVGEDRLDFALYSSISFDLTVTSIYVPLISGSSVIVYDVEDKSQAISRIIKDDRAGVLKLTPTHLRLLLEDGEHTGTKLKRMIVGGEALDANLAQRVSERYERRIEIFNEYGPTETVVGCMIYLFDPDKDTQGSVSIGVPADNVQIYVLDARLQPVPVGVTGEIYISGDGVARGYWRRPELTAEKFIDNPFVPGARMYRTGDLARWLPDGNIEYLGRIDHQVKIRGHRIELGEVEAHLLKAASVLEAVVIAREDEAGQKQLCAYYVADRELPAGELRRALSREMPGYMVPSYFVQLAQLPLTPNGKIDHRALPAPERRTQTGIDYVAARTPMEEQLEQIWKKVLGLPKVGVKDNFFEIGGHSLRATTLVAHLHKELDIEMPLREVFQHPTIEQMAEAVAGREQSAYASIPILKQSAYYPVSSAQKRLYILSQLEGGELSYNMPGAMTVEGALDWKRLEEAFRKLIA